MGEKITKGLERIEHKGVAIFFSDYRRLTPGGFEEQLRENRAALETICERGDYELRILADFTDAIVGGDVMKELRVTAKIVAPYIRATAVVGVVGFRKHLLRMIRLVPGHEKMGQFDDVEAAKDWLAETAKK